MKISRIMNYLDFVAPLDKCIKEDNIGLIVKGRDNIKKVMICLDITKEAVEYAVFSKADLIITHHPFIYNPLYRIENDELISLIRNEIAVISLHTNYDAARLNDVLAEKCYIRELRQIFYEDGISLGRIGITGEVDFYKYIEKIKESLDIDKVKVTGSIPDIVRKAAVGTGSSGSFADYIKDLDADVFITGELKYDVIKSIAYKGPVIVELGHYESEECFIDDLYNLLTDKFLSLEVVKHKKRISTYV